MATKVRYLVLHDNYANRLAEEVERYLNDGWDLHGGVSVAAFDGDEIYAQAITTTVTNRPAYHELMNSNPPIRS